MLVNSFTPGICEAYKLTQRADTSYHIDLYG